MLRAFCLICPCMQTILSPMAANEDFRALHVIVSGNARWEKPDCTQLFGGPTEAKFFYEGEGDLIGMPTFLNGPSSCTPGRVLRAYSDKVLVCFPLLLCVVCIMRVNHTG
jgi:hypothetical protein